LIALIQQQKHSATIRLTS